MPKASATRLKKANNAVMYTASAMIAEKLHFILGCAVRGLGHPGDVFEENALSRGEPRLVEFSLGNRLHCFVVGSLNPQEVGM